jgi:hypothetical protein
MASLGKGDRFLYSVLCAHPLEKGCLPWERDFVACSSLGKGLVVCVLASETAML